MNYRCQHHEPLTEIATDLAKKLAAAEAECDRLRTQAEQDRYAVDGYNKIRNLMGDTSPLPYHEWFAKPKIEDDRHEDSRALCVVIFTSEGDSVHYPMTAEAERFRRTSRSTTHPENPSVTPS